MTELDHCYAFVSGPNGDEFHVLGYRYPKKYGFRPEQCESWLLQCTPDGSVKSLLIQRGWMTGLWRSSSGKVWVSEAGGHIYFNPSPIPRAEPFQTFTLRGVLTGVWGLHDDYVMTWGMRGGEPVVYLFDGRDWTEVDRPPGQITAMHGLRPDLVYAVGPRGLVTRWDGTRWSAPLDSGTDTTLSSVFVVSDDQIWACGQGRSLLEGTTYGWRKVLDYDHPLFCVAVAFDQVWVGAGPRGLLKLVDGALETYRPKVKAEQFDVRGDLVICGATAVCWSVDGLKFRGMPLDPFLDMSAKEPSPW